MCRPCLLGVATWVCGTLAGTVQPLTCVRPGAAQQQGGMANGARNGLVAHEEQQAPKRQRTANAALLVRPARRASWPWSPAAGFSGQTLSCYLVTSPRNDHRRCTATRRPYPQVTQRGLRGPRLWRPGLRSPGGTAAAGQQPGHEPGGGDDPAGDQPAPGEPAAGARGAGGGRQGHGRGRERAAQLAGRQRVRRVRADAADVRAAQRVLHVLRAAHQAQPGAAPVPRALPSPLPYPQARQCPVLLLPPHKAAMSHGRPALPVARQRWSGARRAASHGRPDASTRQGIGEHSAAAKAAALVLRAARRVLTYNCLAWCLTHVPPARGADAAAGAAQVYYTTPMKKSEVKGYWCHACFTETRSENIELDGARIRKARPRPQAAATLNLGGGVRLAAGRAVPPTASRCSTAQD